VRYSEPACVAPAARSSRTNAVEHAMIRFMAGLRVISAAL
jgi:hypothetical protein